MCRCGRVFKKGQAHVVEDMQCDEELARVQHGVGAKLVAQARLLPRLQRQVRHLQRTVAQSGLEVSSVVEISPTPY